MPMGIALQLLFTGLGLSIMSVLSVFLLKVLYEMPRVDSITKVMDIMDKTDKTHPSVLRKPHFMPCRFRVTVVQIHRHAINCPALPSPY
jgi:hypothetical protein